MNQDLQNYRNNIDTPWGNLLYKMVWEQIGNVSGKKILDFGSGFGISANHYAENNKVIAVEPNIDMIENRISDYSYEQLNGSVDILSSMDDETYDLIICHNVLEYIEFNEQVLNRFRRLLKKTGVISIVKHNHTGRIMSKVVFENKIDEAIELLDGAEVQAINFGKVNYYDINQLIKKIDNLRIVKTLGIRTFWGLQQNNEAKYEDNWSDKMLQIESKVSEMDAFRNIAFFHHVFIEKE